MENYKKYMSAIRESICSICADSSEDGHCTLSNEEICAVEQFLPKILEVIHSVDSDDVSDYYEELREKVCGNCKTSSDKDNCYLRDDSNCALDRYFPLIVETVQRVDSAG